MADASFRSKHAGKPGSLIAIRVDYPLSSSAFEPLTAGSQLKKRHEEIDKFIRGPRIGDKADWNASAAGPRFPDRPNMRQNSEFMAVKMEYNYRAATLPTVNHDTTFVPKPNKMQVDRSLFLSQKEKNTLATKCPGTAAAFSRAEIPNGSVPGVELESGWNVSTQLEEQRANIFKTVKYASFVDKNKTKGLISDETYITPIERVSTIQNTVRSLKLSQREGTLASSASLLRSGGSMSAGQDGSGGPAVFKMSNMSEWWNRCPIDLPVQATDESAIDKVSDTA